MADTHAMRDTHGNTRHMNQQQMPQYRTTENQTNLQNRPPQSHRLAHQTPGHLRPLLGSLAARLVPTSTSSSLSPSPLTPPIPTIYLLSLAVDPSARGHGLATRLLQEAMATLLPATKVRAPSQGRGPCSCRVVLHVSKTNVAARRTYEKWGLVSGRESRGHYRGLSGEASVAVEYAGEIQFGA